MHRLQTHWQRLTIVSIALLPLSLLFALVAWLRRACYRSGVLSPIRLAVPVVVVGNITAGGTGKTPVVIWLAQSLGAMGYKPGIISRGYGGDGTQAAVNTDTPPQQAGDEPVLISNLTGCPVWVGRDRPAAARALLAENPQVDVIISDDGLQHYRLARDCEIAVINARQKFGNGLLLPAGPLRETKSRLKEVDAVIINGEMQPELPETGFEMALEGEQFQNLADAGRLAGAGDFMHSRVHAVAGIGDPERFFEHLRSLGLSFETHAFADHHAFSASDLEFADCDVVLMTQKDAIKCAAFARDTWWSLPVQARIDSALLDTVKRKIGSVRGR